ncbi:MAG TPA: glycosyltransferase family 1 protein, partial [Herpetosiphon sp.]|nr:glycosyltransferase family 1 protein [Herpetosiphon sp.]
PAQPQALSAAINDLLNQPERARLLGKAARLRVETELTWNRYAARLEQLYTAAIQSS